jgi:hypothetical protein
LSAWVVDEIAAVRDHVAIMNLWEYLDNDAHLGRAADLGWTHDGLHYSDIGQEAWASLLFNVLAV